MNLEDYFQVMPVSGVVPMRYWSRFERRVERNTETTLDLLDTHGAKATFFVSGWIADAAPDVVQEVVRRGHRIAAKGYRHEFAHRLNVAEFAEDAARAKEALERAGGREVTGYRAARGGLRLTDTARFAALARAGYRYDSSLRDAGFVTPEHTGPFDIRADGETIREVPITSASVLGFRFPAAGGNYLRQLPEQLTQPAIARAAEAENETLVFYFHVWELDPDMPRLNGVSWPNRIRQYRNLDAMRARIERTLARYPFDSAEAALGITDVPVYRRTASELIARDRKASSEALSVVIPCHNEAESLPFLARTLDLLRDKLAGRYSVRFILVDDASTDDTLRVIDNLFANRDDVQVVRHETNRGVSAAIMSGIAAARTDLVASIDCDCSYDPLQIDDLLDAMTPGTAMVTASPYHRHGRVLNVPAWRLALSRGLSAIYGMLLRHKLATYTSCFRVYRKSALSGLVLDHGNYLGIAELLIRLDKAGARIAEVPATLEARLFGRSKMKTLSTIAGHLRLIAGLAFGGAASRSGTRLPDLPTMEKDRG